MHAKNEIVAVARGYYALPILMSLARRGFITQLLADGVTASEFGGSPTHVNAILGYLTNLGWLEVTGEDNRYRATALGSTIMRRSGAFGILYSYRNYMNNLDQLLFEENTKVDVHREDNVVGSGAAHEKKYFSRVSQDICDTEARYVLDVGCGDGTYLRYCKSLRPELQLIGVDYNERALHAAAENLPEDAILFQGNIAEPEVILYNLQRRNIDPKEVLVSVWFIFHEVLGFKDVDLTKLLCGFRELAPVHGLIIGEIFDIPHQVLAAHHNDTAVPEFNLFHDLSGQKLFTLDAWKQAISASGHTEQKFIGLDALPHEDKIYHGSAIWRLG